MKDVVEEIEASQIPAWMTEVFEHVLDSCPDGAPLRCVAVGVPTTRTFPNSAELGFVIPSVIGRRRVHWSQSISKSTRVSEAFRTFEEREFFRIDPMRPRWGLDPFELLG